MELKDIFGKQLYLSQHSTFKETLVQALKHGATLDRLDARGQDLSDILIEGTYYKVPRKTSLSIKGADFEGANLSKSTFQGIDFTDSKFNKKVKAHDTVFNYCIFNINSFQGVEANALTIKGGICYELNAENSSLPNIFISPQFLHCCTFQGCDLNKGIIDPSVQVIDVMLSFSNMNGFSLDGVKSERLSILEPIINEANLRVSNSYHNNASFSGIQFKSPKLDNVRFRNSRINKLSFHEGTIRNLIFEDTNVRDLQAKSTVFEFLDISGSIREGNVHAGELTHSALHDCKIDNANLTGLHLSHNSFNKTSGLGVNLSCSLSEFDSYTDCKFSKPNTLGLILKKPLLVNTRLVPGLYFENSMPENEIDRNEAHRIALMAHNRTLEEFADAKPDKVSVKDKNRSK